MRFFSLASGSSGNITYVGDGNTHILVDVGMTNKRIETALNELDISVKDISAICITHEHIDHIKGLGVLLRKYNIPVYASKGSIRGILETRSLGDFDKNLLIEIQDGRGFQVGEFKINPFSIYHDSYEPLAFRIENEKRAVAVATDMGKYDDKTIEALRGLDAVLIEANHDVRMLELGPYPYHLKRRILSDRGHLSNEHCGKLLCKILHDGLDKIMLGHLSSENNYPELAKEAVKCEISMDISRYQGSDFHIEVAKKEGLSGIYF